MAKNLMAWSDCRILSAQAWAKRENIPGGMNFKNTTHLDSKRLETMFLRAVDGWQHDGLDVSVRFSRGAEFSGTCYYESDRIFVNLGRNNRYPYQLLTNVARPRANRTHWWRELFALELADGYQLGLFVFLHEFYHRLVKRARRNVRQKEARCDRFAARVLVDQYGAIMRDSAGKHVRRDSWDFQDLDGFVAAAGRSTKAWSPDDHPREWPCRTKPGAVGEQLMLFSDV